MENVNFLGKSRVLTNTFSQIAGRSLVIGASLLTTSFLTRVLGISGYGNYVFITSFIMLFVSLSDLGTTVIAVRECSADPSKRSSIFNVVLTIRLFLIILLLLFFNFLVFCLPQFTGLRPIALIASLVLPFLALKTTIQAVFQTHLRLDLCSLLEIFSSAVLLLLLFVGLFFQGTFSLFWVMSCWTFSAFLTAIVGIAISVKYTHWKLIFVKEEVKKLVKEALPLGISLLVYAVYDRGIDNFIIKTYLNSSAVGYYGLAYKVHGNLVLGAAFLMNSLFPLISSVKNNLPKLRILLEKTFTVLIVAGLFVFLLGMVFAPLVVTLIAGDKFFPSILTLRILLFATFFTYLNHLTGYSMIALGHQRELLKFSLLGLLINIIFNVLFIPKMSFYAAAFATILTEGSLFLLTFQYLVKNYRFGYSPKIFLENMRKLFINKQKFFDIF